MKNLLATLTLLIILISAQPARDSAQTLPVGSAPNIIVVTIDGFRWQEIFSGADEELINDPVITPDTSTMKMLYWADDKNERRQKLMPFFWNVIAAKGQLYGNRDWGNKVNTANLYAFSYPGYNEIFTGTTDITISSNEKKLNSNRNVLEYLNQDESFKGKVVAFTSWDVFPYILNEKRSGFPINSGYENVSLEDSSGEWELINRVQTEGVHTKTGTRHDQLTFLMAKEYMQRYQPRVVFIGLGETDESAHAGRYDLYLEHANTTDRLLAELWHFVQSTPGYKDNTSLLITTDHGRGKNKWTSHSAFIRGSSQTWLALLGPGVKSLGEVKDREQLYQNEMAGTIARMVGADFKSR
ncbi:MAG TPA: hypothetical protein VK644_08410 [Chitinophagaceae bacterium]|nr:hypothetical protein [Chitinophagaceae bacterium]